MAIEWQRAAFDVSDDRRRLDIAAIHRFISRDAHDLYTPFGFRAMPEATRYLEIHRPDVYKATPEATS